MLKPNSQGQEFPPVAALQLKPRKITAGKACDSTRAFLQYLCLAANFQRVPLVWSKSLDSPTRAQAHEYEGVLETQLGGGHGGTLSVALSGTVAQLTRRICAFLGLDHEQHWLLLVADDGDNDVTVLSQDATLRQCGIQPNSKVQLQYKYAPRQRVCMTTWSLVMWKTNDWS